MASWETLAAFATILAVFAYVPGPSTLYAAAQTMARGRKAGLLAAVGLHLGGYVHVGAAAFGLSAVLTVVPAAYVTIKALGAMYLVWLGINIIRSRDSADGNILSPRFAGRGSTFSQSIVVEILNPKAALFFLAFLPQFVDPAGALSISSQMLVLGCITLLVFSSADVVAVLLASFVVRKLSRSGTVQRAFKWISGLVLVALGARLVAESRR